MIWKHDLEMWSHIGQHGGHLTYATAAGCTSSSSVANRGIQLANSEDLSMSHKGFIQEKRQIDSARDPVGCRPPLLWGYMQW
jgi:hypothetical protein